MSDRVMMDASTGEESREPLTAEEEAERDRRAQDAESKRRAEDAESGRESSLRTQADDALATLRTIANSEGPLTAMQLSQSVRFMARVLIGIVRLVIRRLDATD